MSQINEQILADILSAATYERISLDIIKPAPYNPRVDLTPEDPEYQRIKRSIIDHGMVQPIVYNQQTGNAVGGNQRLKILKELGIKDAVCAVVRMPLIREMEASVALNKLGNLWNREQLREIMLQMKENDYDVTRTAFDQAEIDSITQDLNITVSGFFEDQDQEETQQKEKPVHQYKCPYCGEVFTK
ncbi:MAG: ParB N-terminal domain-containing protein [Selenomonadaceae bacterium]|nr:ParB N-terminal domain-containing protein [Clostridia bacterium]MBR4695408.1 ParB N-terminal domain-containing protein [Selenomonadaceae bacterium]